MIHKWITNKKEKAGEFKIFDVYWMNRTHPGWNKDSNFVMIDSPNWVNIVPVTKNQEVVLVKQFRHGVNDFTLEIPGGLISNAEDPAKAATRECLEETGWGSKSEPVFTGKNYPNPAFMNNTCYSYAWFNCEKLSEQNLDGNEEIEVVKVPIKEISKYIDEFKIQNALVLTGFMFFFLKYGFNSENG